MCVCAFVRLREGVNFLEINQQRLPGALRLVCVITHVSSHGLDWYCKKCWEKKKKKKKAHTWSGRMGKVHGTRPCALWKGRTTAGSTGIQGTRPEAGGCGTEPWCCCRSYAPRFTLPVAAFNKVTNGSPALCAIRYCPLSNLENQMKSTRVCESQNPHIETCHGTRRDL